MIITREQLLDWVGSDNKLMFMEKVLLEIVNKEYTVDELRKDVLDYANIEEKTPC